MGAGKQPMCAQALATCMMIMSSMTCLMLAHLLRRAVCERRALRCARELLVNSARFADMRAAAAHADAARADGAQPYHALQPDA